MGSRLVVGSAHHKNTDAKVERANGVSQGWQGRAGSLTSAPRPATPVETSAPRPATPSDPGLVRDSPGILHVTPQGDAHPTPGRQEA